MIDMPVPSKSRSSSRTSSRTDTGRVQGPAQKLWTRVDVVMGRSPLVEPGPAAADTGVVAGPCQPTGAPSGRVEGGPSPDPALGPVSLP